MGRVDQCYAEKVVWDMTYHEVNEPPTVIWVSELHSPVGQIGGRFTKSLYLIEIIPTVDWFTGQEYTYAHEMLHAHLANKFGDADGTHSRVEYWGMSTSGALSHYIGHPFTDEHGIYHGPGLLDTAIERLHVFMPKPFPPEPGRTVAEPPPNRTNLCGRLGEHCCDAQPACDPGLSCYDDVCLK